MKSHAFAVALLFSASGYALAADAVVDEVVVVESGYDWSGVYVGANLGWAWLNSDLLELEKPR